VIYPATRDPRSMSATASSPTDQSTNCTTSTFSRAGRFRRFSHLRNYTQNHLSHHHASSPSERHTLDRISHLTRAIGFTQPHSSDSSGRSSERSLIVEQSSQAAPGNTHRGSRRCLEANNRGSSQERAPQSYRGVVNGTSGVENQTSHSHSDSNTPTPRARPQEPHATIMARHRTSTATNGSVVHNSEPSHTPESSSGNGNTGTGVVFEPPHKI
jgi:hypothetical protein